MNEKLGSFMLKYLKQKDSETCKSHVSENEQVMHNPSDVDELQVDKMTTFLLTIAKV